MIDYIIERNVPIKNFQVDAANLVSNKKWVEFFTKCGHRLESLKLAWLDSSFDDKVFKHLIQCCPNLKRLKLKKCFLLGDQALEAIVELKQLEHLSLRFPASISAEVLAKLISSIGSKLRTLSLECFYNADDTVLEAIHATCVHLEKLCFCENDLCTDAGFAQLFTNWSNPPLTHIDLNSNRSVDYNLPEGTEEPTGLASAGFQAMTMHSGSNVETLDISSCRHIERDAFERVLDGNTQFTHLKDLNISFLTKIDTPIVAAMFKNSPSLRKLTAFGCFNITDAVVPKGVALIGLPNAQAEIEQEGSYDWDVVNDVLMT